MNHLSSQMQYPCPLSVGFYCWEDQCTPMLSYTCFKTISWTQKIIPGSKIWGLDHITSILFAGARCGTIVAYRICSSDEKIIGVTPLCFFCGHTSEIVSIVQGTPYIFGSTIATLSIDGTFSLVSVEDLTILKHHNQLFSNGSVRLAIHQGNSNLMLASQSYGTIEVADITNANVIIRLTGFSSIILGLFSHKNNHSVSTADGKINVFSANIESTECLYHISPLKEDDPISKSLLSPDCEFALSFTPKKWYLFDSPTPLFEMTVPKNDKFVNAEWLSSSRFAIIMMSGKIQIWDSDTSIHTDIYKRFQCESIIFLLKSLSEATTVLKPKRICPPEDTNKSMHKAPVLVFETQVHPGSPIGFTPEGFIISSPSNSVLDFKTSQNQSHLCNLNNYFKSEILCRYPIGNPVHHEARISVKRDIYLDGILIGSHPLSSLLFCPNIPRKKQFASESTYIPKKTGNKIYHRKTHSQSSLKDSSDKQTNRNLSIINSIMEMEKEEYIFFSGAKDGSICVWSTVDKEFKEKMHPMCEPVKKMLYIKETRSVIAIGDRNSFCVIDFDNLFVTAICGGHDSPIKDIYYSSRVYNAKCESSTIFSWSTKGRLVSKHSEKSLKRMGQSLSVPDEQPDNQPCFVQNVIVDMPGCQTFAIIFDALAFLESGVDLQQLSTSDNSDYLDLLLLWRHHMALDFPLNIDPEFPQNVEFNEETFCKKLKGLEDFHYAIGGANFTVTLPIVDFHSTRTKEFQPNNTKDQEQIFKSMLSNLKGCPVKYIHQQLSRATDLFAFRCSSLVSATHSIAASIITQFFVERKNSPLTQNNSQLIENTGVMPSLIALTDWIGIDDPQLRTSILLIMDQVINNLTEEAALNFLKQITNFFSKPLSLLPIEIFIVKKFSNPEVAARAIDLFIPNIIEHSELVDILISAFGQFVPFMSDFVSFFKVMIMSTTPQQCTSMGVYRPLEFFDTFSLLPNFELYFQLLFESWKKPDRSVFCHFIEKLVKLENSLISSMQRTDKDFTKLYNMISDKATYFSFCQNFLVFGNSIGEAVAYDRLTGQEIWRKMVAVEPITFISISPNGQRFLFIVQSDQMLTWVSKSKKNADEFYEMVDSIEWNENSSPNKAEWINQKKVALYSENIQMCEMTFPETGFFKRVFKKK